MDELKKLAFLKAGGSIKSKLNLNIDDENEELGPPIIVNDFQAVVDAIRDLKPCERKLFEFEGKHFWIESAKECE